jgi:hypothetical protein
MGGSSSSITNTISNYTVNKSSLEVLNQQVNSFVSNSVTTSASACSASSTAIIETTMGDIIAKGKGNKIKIGIDSEQDTALTLECLQQSIQQTNISNSLAQSIMTNLTQSVSADVLNKMVAAGEAKNEQGFGANPFASASSTVNMNLSNTNITETNRKLSNLISNSVESNVKNEDIKKCFLEMAAAINNKIGDIMAIGENNEIELQLTSKQTAKAFAKCQQLTEQTSAVTTSLAVSCGLTIVDDSKTKTSNDTQAESKASAKTAGLNDLVDSVGNAAGNLFGLGFLGAAAPFIIAACACCCCCIIIIIIFKVMSSGGSSPAPTPSTEDTSAADTTADSSESASTPASTTDA